MRPEWLWALVPAIVLAGLLWRLRHRSGSWSSVIAPDLLPYLIGDKLEFSHRTRLVALPDWRFQRSPQTQLHPRPFIDLGIGSARSGGAQL